MHKCQATLDELKKNLCDIQVERDSLDEREKAIRLVVDSLERLIKLETIVAIDHASAKAKSSQLSPTSTRNTAIRNCPLCKTTCDKGHLMEHASEALQRGEKQTDIAKILGVSYYTITDWKAQLGLRKPQLQKKKAEVLKEDSPAPPLRAKNLVLEKERQGREASQRLKEFKQSVQAPAAKPSGCGKCETKIIDGKPFLVSQPDCPTHGTGLETVQAGRERKGDPIYIKGSSL